MLKTYEDLLEEQINLLCEWNKKNIEAEPEQVRKNIETISEALKVINQ